MRQPFNDPDGSGIDGRQPHPELGKGCLFNSLYKAAQDVIEYFDLLVIQAIGVVKKKVGNPTKCVDAAFARADLNGAFQLINQ